jgi:hypothetical protein
MKSFIGHTGHKWCESITSPNLSLASTGPEVVAARFKTDRDQIDNAALKRAGGALTERFSHKPKRDSVCAQLGKCLARKIHVFKDGEPLSWYKTLV